MYYYRVDCWIPPQSGFDLLKKNQAFKFIESIADKLNKDNEKKIKDYLEEFKRLSDGYTLKTFTMESDIPVFNPDKEFMEEIRKEIPEARLASWSLLEAPVVKNPIG